MNYYTVLGVEKNSTADEIKKAYRKLSLRFHPDKPNGDETKFKEINEAFQVLGDTEKRQMYDNQGNPRNIHRQNNFDDVFKMFFDQNSFPPFFDQGNGFPPNIKIVHNGVPINFGRQIKRPVPICKTITLSFKDAFNGVNYPIMIERWIAVSNVKKMEREKIYVDIPKGIDDGEIIVIKNKGNVIDSQNKGDIKIFIKIVNDTNFVREGLNLVCQKDISLKEALTGFKYELTYLNDQILSMNNNGDVIITPSFVKVIPNYGFERSGQKGNLIIKFNIQFPKHLTNEQREEIKKIL